MQVRVEWMDMSLGFGVQGEGSNVQGEGCSWAAKQLQEFARIRAR